MTGLNIFYGILTNGDNSLRKTTAKTPTDESTRRVVAAIIPENASAPCKRALAELYIRVIQTDKELQVLLNKIDSVNSYKLHSFTEPFSDEGVETQVLENIKALGLPDVENSALLFDYVKIALKFLLDKLNATA